MKIIKEPNELLHKITSPVDNINSKIKKLISEMKKTMVENNGIGIAANQVGIDLAIFVIDEKLAVENRVPQTYINPEIKPYSKIKDVLEEGCLSLPGIWVRVGRLKKVKVKALDEKGNKIRFIAKGLLARVLQHEYDHLQGVLIKDREEK